jgi:tetratricopeptide (TPR) repeat protein
MIQEKASTPDLRREILRLIQAKDWQGALDNIDQALKAAPDDAKLHFSKAQCLLALGRPAEACEAAAAAQSGASSDPLLLDAIGTLFSRANDQPRALAAYEQAVSLAPGNPHYIYNRATVYRFLGRLAESEADYDRVIALKATDFEAYTNRSELRSQSADANHIDELEALVARGIADWRGEVQVRYALAKEYEDLGKYQQSFRHLRQGAAKRREHMRYDVATDAATFGWIIDAYPGDTPRNQDTARSEDAAGSEHVVRGETTARGEGAPSDAPVFIVGLPRSGTTLVDRILGSHSKVHSAGELDHFALALVDAVRRASGGAQLSRRELIARSADLDFAALGQDYLDRAKFAAAGSERFTDKMPLNYLYCGLIRRALPNARIVNVFRSPMAACYAMYKTLFKDAYPFSYDLAEIARYYIGYRRLMDHWQTTLPGAIHAIGYEAVVAGPRDQIRKLLDFCGLEWQDSCAEFHKNPAPTTTASAAQVRRPLYDSSVSQWRHYAEELAELSALLNAGGISTDEAP